MFLSVRSSVRPVTLLAQCLEMYLSLFDHQTYSKIQDALWETDERVIFQGLKVKVQGHSEYITLLETSLYWRRQRAYSCRRYILYDY